MHQLGLTQTPLNDRSIALLRFIAKHSQRVAHSPCLSPLLSQPTPTRLSSSARHQNGFYEQHLTHSHLTELHPGDFPAALGQLTSVLLRHSHTPHLPLFLLLHLTGRPWEASSLTFLPHMLSTEQCPGPVHISHAP